MHDLSDTASAGAAGKKVFLTDFEAPSTGRFYIAVGSEESRPHWNLLAQHHQGRDQLTRNPFSEGGISRTREGPSDLRGAFKLQREWLVPTPVEILPPQR